MALMINWLVDGFGATWPVVQAKEVLHHQVLMALDDASIHAFFHACHDLGFSHLVSGLVVDAQQFEHPQRAE